MNNNIEPNYMGGWNTSQAKITAYQIDNIADKSSFAIDMINNALLGFDAIEKELIEISNAPTPPQANTLRVIAARIDTNQKQVQDGLLKLKQLMTDIDRATDNLQNSRGTW